MDEIRWDLIFIGRTALAAVLAFVMGWEREARGAPAGDRTYALVALGAAAFTTIGVDSFPSTAEKLIAGVVPGVGFLGAGMIMREGGSIKGLTTAASIWAVAAIGVVVGAGDYVIGVALAVLILLSLEGDYRPVVSRLRARGKLEKVLLEEPAPAAPLRAEEHG